MSTNQRNRGREREPPGEPPAYLPPPAEPPEGPSFVIVTKEQGSFTNANPFALKRTLDALCGPVQSAKSIRSGSLLIETHDRDQAAHLLATHSLAGQAVTVKLADRLNVTLGCIRSDALTSLTNETLLQELAPQGVCQVGRLRSRDIERLGPNPTIKVGFRGALPQHVFCGYLRVPVSPWVPAPILCHRCWQYGRHSTKACRRRREICGRCGREDHSADNCTHEHVCCPSCDEAHPAWDRHCPARQQAMALHRQHQDQRRAEHRAQGRHPQTPWGPQPTGWPQHENPHLRTLGDFFPEIPQRHSAGHAPTEHRDEPL